MDVPALQAQARLLQVELDPEQADRLIRYVALLERWNARFNLVSRKDIGRIWPRHILDSLSVMPMIADAGDGKIRRALDVGTGAGLPGLPLAIAGPAVQWLLLDRNQRKIRFLETVIRELGLENVEARAEDLRGGETMALDDRADLVVSRAVDAPSVVVSMVEPLLSPTGCLVLFTGASLGEGPGQESAEQPDEEKDAGTHSEIPDGDDIPGFKVQAVREVVIPGLDRTHEVTIIVREGSGSGRGEMRDCQV